MRLSAQLRLKQARDVLKQAEERAGVRPIEQRHFLPEMHNAPDKDVRWLSDVLEVSGGNQCLFHAVTQVLPAMGWVAFVGVANVGWLNAAHQGIPLRRALTIPQPGSRAAEVIAVLLDGIDVVCVGDIALSNSQQRRLAGRARRSGHLIMTQFPWVGVSISMDRLQRWSATERKAG